MKNEVAVYELVRWQDLDAERRKLCLRHVMEEAHDRDYIERERFVDLGKWASGPAGRRAVHFIVKVCRLVDDGQFSDNELATRVRAAVAAYRAALELEAK